MGEVSGFALRALVMGVGATLVMDSWLFLQGLFGVPVFRFFPFLGRWIGHMPEGRWFHERIADASPVRGERWLGWGAHYTVGISFAALTLAVCGPDWVRAPTLVPALSVGIGSMAAPLFIQQPALGAGILSSKTPTPLRNCLKSLANHTVFGFGLYLAALAAAVLMKN